MTIADLQTKVGVARRYFAKIGGIKEIYWQRFEVPDETGTPVGEGAPGGANRQDSTLVAYWPLDEFSDSADAEDISGNGYTMVANGTPGLVSDGKICRARNFDADTEWFQLADQQGLRLQRFTIALWVRFASTTQPNNFKVVFKDHLSYADTLRIGNNTGASYLGKSALEFGLRDTDGVLWLAQYDAVLATDTWHHVVATFDGTLALLYVNGELRAVAILSKPIAYDADVWTLGRDSATATEALRGDLDDVAIYAEPKSAEWVRRMYQGGSLYSRPGLECLRLPDEEWGHSINLGSMEQRGSSITLELDNIEDPTDPTKYYFAKLLAPGAWQGAGALHTTTIRQAQADTQIDPDETTVIYVRKTASFDAFPADGAEIYIGTETLGYGVTSYASTNTANGYPTGLVGALQELVRGLYPAFINPRGGSTTDWAETIEHPQVLEHSKDDLGGGAIVSTKLRSFIGRFVGLYVTTWDPAERRWRSEETDAELVWAGRVATSVDFDPRSGSWKLACEHILTDMEREVCVHMPSAALYGINLNGNHGRTFSIREDLRDSASGYVLKVIAELDVVVDAGYYTPHSLTKEINDKINAAAVTWTNLGGTHGDVDIIFRKVGDAVTISISGSGALNKSYTFVTAGSGSDSVCHALQVLGFDCSKNWIVECDSNGKGELEAENPPYYHYQPCSVIHNGMKAFVLEQPSDMLWDDQGDYGTARATLKCDDAKVDGGQTGDETKFFFEYTARTQTSKTFNGLSIEGTELTLAWDQPIIPLQNKYGFVGSDDQHEPPRVQQVLRRHFAVSGGDWTGPFGNLLYQAVSTGKQDYNDSAGSHDKIKPPRAALSIPVALIDTASFLNADLEVLAHGALSIGRDAAYVTEGVKWKELFQREAKLFGRVLVWASGKLTVRNVFSPETASAAVQLDDSNTAVPDDMPSVEMDVSTVINTWRYKIGYDIHTDEYRTEITLRDEASVQALKQVRERSLEHPWIAAGIPSAGAEVALANRIQEEMWLLGSPWQRVRRTLDPTLYNQIYAGDWVDISFATGHPDPFGSGAMSATGKALVLGVDWSPATHTGIADILIWSTFDASRVAPWAPIGAFDVAASNAGWNAVAYKITLLAHEFTYGEISTHDGRAFLAGYKCTIRERHPENPAAPATGPWTVTVHADGYDTPTRTLQLNAVTLTGYSSDREYVIGYDDYAAVVAAQKADAVWGASNTTHLLNAADAAYRWG
jgi:hypothetical protein